jgi:ribosome-binding protein aMBF1 (putative translation factor)
MKICDRCTNSAVYECLIGEVHGASIDLCKSCYEEFDVFLRPPAPEPEDAPQAPAPTPRKGVRTYGKRS